MREGEPEQAKGVGVADSFARGVVRVGGLPLEPGRRKPPRLGEPAIDVASAHGSIVGQVHEAAGPLFCGRLEGRDGVVAVES